MYKTINLRRRTTRLYGAYAKYFRLSPRRGVKVYGSVRDLFAERGVPTKREINYDEVKGDFWLMKCIECPITPKAYRIVAVKLKGLWFPGIVMEHVDGVDAAKYTKYNEKNTDTLLVHIGENFKRLTGYRHEDLNRYNVLLQRKTGTYKVIDITTDYATPLV
jgi:hypothetical protein